MKKVENIKNVLNFYVLANKMKTTLIDEIHNYSIADHVFGTMMIAIAMDSEFKEISNLPKLLRMIVLDYFSRLNPDYDICRNLKKGAAFKKEIDEARSFQSLKSRVIFKYEMLDFMLTKLLSEQGKNLEYSELKQEAVKLMMPKSVLEQFKFEAVFKFYYLTFNLKNKIRSGWDNNHWNIDSKRVERVSEHIVGTILLALAMDSEFDYSKQEEKDRQVDIDKVIELLALHEVGESLIGDITPFDGVSPEEKKILEKKAIGAVLLSLKDKTRLLSKLDEFLEVSTNEAKFAYLCDKMEADLQSKYYQDSGQHNSLDKQQGNVSFSFERVQSLLDQGAETAFDVWYGLDKHIYEDSSSFKEFVDKLKVIKDNNLLTLHEGRMINKVDLSSTEHHFLVEEICEAIRPLYQDDNVDAVYMMAFQSSQHEKGVIYVEVLLKDQEDYSTYKKIFEKIIGDIYKKNKTGVKVDFGVGHVSDYSIIAMNPSEVYRVESLTEASILFDKSGALTEVRDEMKECSHVYPFYLVDFEPSIEEAVLLQLQK